MKRIVAVVAALGLAAAACGSGDDAGSEATVEASTESVEASSEEASDDVTDEMTEPEASGDTDTGEATADEMPDEVTDDDGSDGDSADDDTDGTGSDDDAVSSGPIRSIGDMPEACREQRKNFLREVEPIVSTIDWQTATLADFEAIATQFESVSTNFEQENVVAGCDDLDFVDDNEFELMIEFAEDQAPGTVSFLRFLNQVNPAAGSGDDGDSNGSATGAGFADCAEAIDFVQGLIDDYDNFTEVPAAELMRISSLSTIYLTCSPDQLEFFDSPEFTEFLG